MRILSPRAVVTTLAILVTLFPLVHAAPGDPVLEVCPSFNKVGNDVICYPLQFTASTEMHPSGIPIIAYLFVRSDYPHGSPVSALIMAHGSGSMYSSANHNKGLNSKQLQWVRQYTQDLGIPTLHVDSFQSRYLLADTVGDQRMFDWKSPPAPDSMGGDDYRATSSAGGQQEGDAYVNVAFDPNADGWKDQSNGGGGVSEVTERPYDMEAAYEFLVGNLTATLRANATGETLASGFTPGTTDTIGNLVPNLVIDPAAVAISGTSHGGQTALATADRTRATSISNPMGLGGPNNDGRRFAAFFDYYGGCSMYGAFGGVSNSTWEPYAPFLMLHGEFDPIWTDGATGTTVKEQYESAECGQRIAKAKAIPGFNTLLESVLYKGAEHSFDGVVVGDIGSGGTSDSDYPSWLAKIHSNYQIVVPMLEAARQVAHSGGSLDLADFGFHSGNPWFTTFPFDPSLPPQATFLTLTDNTNASVAIIGSMNSGSLDISQYVNDPFNYHTMTYALAGAPTKVSIDASGLLTVAYSGSDATGLNASFLLIAESDHGQTVMQVTLSSADGTNGELMFGESVSITPASFTLGAPGSISFPLSVLMGGADLLTTVNYSVAGLPAGLSLTTNGMLTGGIDPADLPAEFTVVADMGGLAVEGTVQFSLNANGEVVAVLGGMSSANIGDGEIPLPLDPLNPPLGSGPTNQPPVANAGTDAFVDMRDTVTLNGSASSDPDGGVITYAWSQTAGPNVVLSNSSGALATFIAPEVATTTSLTFQLVVTDSENAAASDSVTVTINATALENNAPAGNAGGDTTVSSGATVTLNGSNSSDPDGDAITYAWTQTAGASVTLSNNNTAQTTFTAPNVSSTTTLTFTLTVTDEHGLATTDSVNTTVNPASTGGGNGSSGGGGGGALFWLLPFVLLLRRR